MFPAVDEGSVMISGSTKQMPSSAMRIPAGTHSRSVRPIRCDRRLRALTRDGNRGAAAVASIASGVGTAIPDPWFEYRVRQVGEEVAEHGHQREDQRDPLDEGRVVIGDAGQQV